MITIYIVQAFGGSYEEAWEHNLRAFYSRADAEKMIADYERWIEVIRTTEDPNCLTDPPIEEGEEWDDAAWDRHHEIKHEMEQEFRKQVLIDLGVPEEDYQFMIENWEHSYDCDRPNYTIEELELV